ncbi:hypothetical protein C8J56DRAFT_882048 [Mycena floridula]|nr:hypothetical protein C8J56DRAFT_882048 [Mycena floridula]
MVQARRPPMPPVGLGPPLKPKPTVPQAPPQPEPKALLESSLRSVSSSLKTITRKLGLDILQSPKDSIDTLQKLVLGESRCTKDQLRPGKFVALGLDYETTLEGTVDRSKPTRVIVVNYHGAIQLDEFVRQDSDERPRRQWSGNLVNAKPLEEITEQVAPLIKDRILVGNDLHNHLKVLGIRHFHSQRRDTRHYSGKFKISIVREMALRELVKQELDLEIKDGEHSIVTKTRATMALYRLRRRDWEKGNEISNEES